MITISTTSAADARFMIETLRRAPVSVSYEVFLAGTRIARRGLSESQPEVEDPARWPQAGVEYRRARPGDGEGGR